MSEKTHAPRLAVTALLAATAFAVAADPARAQAKPAQATALLADVAPDQQALASLLVRGDRFLGAVLRTRPGRALPKDVRESLLTRPDRHVDVRPYGRAASNVIAVDVRAIATPAAARALAQLLGETLVGELRRRRADRRRERLAVLDQTRQRLTDQIATQRTEVLKKRAADPRASLTALRARLAALAGEIARLELALVAAKRAVDAFTRSVAARAVAQSPDVLRMLRSDPVLAALRDVQVRLELEHEVAAEDLDPKDEEFLALEARMGAIKKRIAVREKELVEASAALEVLRRRRRLTDRTAQLAEARRMQKRTLTEMRGLDATVTALRRIDSRERTLLGELDRQRVRRQVLIDLPGEAPRLMGVQVAR